MTRIAALALAITCAITLIALGIQDISPLVLIALAIIAVISVTASVALSRSRNLADRAYQRGYRDGSNT
ncbi:hypothetical protein ACFMQL_20230 [Nonomuraea fastidiosa]|uniref:hypothetical protein n=1 Tax=Nonomuraea fastidiosa TaxID=46173 RepID=UPI00366E52EC